MFPQVRLALEPFTTVAAVIEPLLRAGLGRPGAGRVPVTTIRLVALLLRLVPAPMRREVGWAAEHLVTLGTPVLHPDYSGALVLSQSERVRVRLPAQLADKLTDRLRSGRLLLRGSLFNFEPENRRRGDVIFEVQFPDSFGFLGRRFAFALGLAGSPFGGGVRPAAARADLQVNRGEEGIEGGERRERLGGNR